MALSDSAVQVPIHATKKLLDRVKHPVTEPVAEPSTLLGNWYGTALFWKPQVALFVNEGTLLPVLVPLAPAADLHSRFPDDLARVLDAIGAPIDFVAQEILAMTDATFAKTANRSVIGSTNLFAFMAETWRTKRGGEDLLAISAWLAHTPCSPLYKRTGFPDLEVLALVEQWAMGSFR